MEKKSYNIYWRFYYLLYYYYNRSWTLWVHISFTPHNPDERCYSHCVAEETETHLSSACVWVPAGIEPRSLRDSASSLSTHYAWNETTWNHPTFIRLFSKDLMVALAVDHMQVFSFKYLHLFFCCQTPPFLHHSTSFWPRLLLRETCRMWHVLLVS